MRILAIGAHPDDIEIFMFGLLKKLKIRGDHIFLAIVTDGCQGGNIPKKDLVKIRKKRQFLVCMNLENHISLIYLMAS